MVVTTRFKRKWGRISEALKERFRLVCIELAGGKDFSVLGPFVAAMYKVTKEELDIALAECRSTKIVGGLEVPKRKMVPKSMPLLSFPWLFEKELSRIATSTEATDDIEGLGLQTLDLKGDANTSRKPAGVRRGVINAVDLDDYIQQEDGRIIHRGEELDLFRADANSDSAGESEFDDARVAEDRRSFLKGNSGELVLNTSFQPYHVPNQLLSGTGVEDVVPRTILEGFVDPRDSAETAHNSCSSSPFGVGHKDSAGRKNSSVLKGGTSDSFPAASAHVEEDMVDLEENVVEIEEVIDFSADQSALEKACMHDGI